MIRSCVIKLSKTKNLFTQQHIANTTQLFNLNISRLHSHDQSSNFDEPFELIEDYVDPDIRTNHSRPMLVKKISKELNCSIADAMQITHQQKSLKPFTFRKISSIAAFLKSKEVPLASIMENSWLFSTNLREYSNSIIIK